VVLCRACQDETWFNEIYVYRCGTHGATGDMASDQALWHPSLEPLHPIRKILLEASNVIEFCFGVIQKARIGE
jgi:hypothetical protein